ncbi:MAG: alpha/beta hydrolase [Dehalococcoidia bacterium]|nr:alpha/beta hydrolase [Dehalococcoidia bacterium]
MSKAQLEKVIELLTSRERPENPTIEDSREGFEKMMRVVGGKTPASIRQVDAGGVPSELVSAGGASEDTVTLYLHGGGYVIGSPKTHREFARRLSAASQAQVLVIDYRLAPESPFPAPVEDAISAYRWLMSEGYAPERIAIAGDSAGGGLTVAILVSIRDQGLPMPACGVCLSPWVDMEGIGDSMTSRADRDPMVQKEGLVGMAGLYLADADPRSPLAAPMYADLEGLPPLLIQVGASETLFDDAVRLDNKARAAGVETSFEEWDDMIHVWHIFAPMLDEGQKAIERMAEFMREKWNGS